MTAGAPVRVGWLNKRRWVLRCPPGGLTLSGMGSAAGGPAPAVPRRPASPQAAA
jgi:hypothetical protein